MFPLNNRKVQRSAAAHVKAGLGIGTDYYANYITFYIPFDGVGKKYWGKEGGNWYRITRSNGDRIELAHLSKYSAPNGNVRAGQLGGVTGNSGAITTGPHLHIQIFNKAGIRLDPEKYDWGSVSLKRKGAMFGTYKGTIYLLAAGYWIAVATKYEEFLADWGNQEAPPLTAAQFSAFPTQKRVIK